MTTIVTKGTFAKALAETEVVAGGDTLILRLIADPGYFGLGEVRATQSGTVSGVETDGSAALDDTGAPFDFTQAYDTYEFIDGHHWVKVTDSLGNVLRGHIGTNDLDADGTRVAIYSDFARTTQNWIEGGATAFDFINTPVTYEIYDDAIWHPDIGSDSAATTALLAGIAGPGVEAAGWEVNGPALTFANVTRTSDYEVTITLPAAASYDTVGEEKITITVPAAALIGVDAALDPAYVWVKPGSVIDIDANLTEQTVFEATAVYLIDSAIESTANVIFQGASVLRMRAGGNLTFTASVESSFVGGGNPADATAVPTTDHGLWFLEDATYDLQGTNRVRWNKTGDDATWDAGDELVEGPVADGVYSYTTGFTKGGTPTSFLGSDSVTYSAKVMNLTSDVTIKGASSTAKAHVFHNSTRSGYRFNVRFENLGVSISTASPEADGGRYMIHIHHQNMHAVDTTRGNYGERNVYVESETHAVVPHESDHSVEYGSVTHKIKSDHFWWDPGDQSANIRWQECYAAVDSVTHGDTSIGFLIGSGENLTNSWLACQETGCRDFGNTAGSNWPEASNGLPNIWHTRECELNNNVGHAIAVWQNTGTDPHLISNFLLYHNEKGSIDHGAYRTRGYHYQSNSGGLGQFKIVDDGSAGIIQHAQNSTTMGRLNDGYGLSFENINIYGSGVPSLFFERHNLPLDPGGKPCLYKNISFGANNGGIKIVIDEDNDEFTHTGFYDIVFDSGFTGTKISTATPLSEITITQAMDGSVLRIQDPDATPTAVEIDLFAGTVTTIDPFYEASTIPFSQGVAPTVAESGIVAAAPSSTTVVSSAFTPAADDVLTIAVSSRTKQTAAPVLSGGGQTYESLGSAIHASEDMELYAYRCKVSGSPGSMQVTATLDTSSIRAAINIVRHSGADVVQTTNVEASAFGGNHTDPAETISTHRTNSHVLSYCTTANTAPLGAGDVADPTVFLASISTGGASAERAHQSVAYAPTTDQGEYTITWLESFNPRSRVVMVEVMGLVATAPDPPTGVTATLATPTSATVSWTAPVDTGTSAIIDYTVFPESAGQTQLAPVTTAATSLEFTGLLPGTTYRFSVTARNSEGDSLQSASSEDVVVAVADPTSANQAFVSITTDKMVAQVYVKFVTGAQAQAHVFITDGTAFNPEAYVFDVDGTTIVPQVHLERDN